MVTLDRIRLTGLLRKAPHTRGFLLRRNGLARERLRVVQELPRLRQRLLLLGHDRGEGAARPAGPLLLGRVAEEQPDQPLGAVETAPEVVVLPAGPAEERPEVHDRHAGELRL